MGFAPSFDPISILLAAIPGVALYLFYLYCLSAALTKCQLSQQVLIAAIVVDLLFAGPQRTLTWTLFGPYSFLVGLFRPPVPLSALMAVVVLAFTKSPMQSSLSASSEKP